MATPDEIDADFRSFIAEHIHSVAKLESLLLLHADPKKSWSAAEATAKLCTALEMTTAILEELRERGLVTVSEASDARYSFAPKTEKLQQSVDDLARLYQQRRVTVITLIYTEPVDTLRTFANAFRFRRDKKDT